MKQISLTKGFFATVDDDLYDLLNSFKWHYDCGYASRRERKTQKKIYMHRVVCPTPKGLVVDHIDRNKLNNTRSNLRPATTQQNILNGKKFKNAKSSRYRGVSFYTPGKWVARINLNRKTIKLGIFTDELAAFAAYTKAKNAIFEISS